MRKIPEENRIKYSYLLILIVLSLAILLFVFFLVRNYKIETEKQFYYNYKGKLIEFRRPINLVKKISVIPNESSLNHSTYLLSLGVFKNITFIIFKYDDNEATALQTLEIGTKLIGLLRYELGLDEEINVKAIKIEKGLDEVEKSNREYYIFLRSFLISNESYVKVHNYNLIEITGKNLEEFDLAAMKFLIYFLENMKKIY